MPLPNLIHPISITVESFDRSHAAWDKGSGQQVHSARAPRAASFSIPAQIKWDKYNQWAPQPAGTRMLASGSITVRYADLATAGKSIKVGDRITAIGTGSGAKSGLDLYITVEEPMAVWPDQGGPTLAKFRFEDRAPQKGGA